MILETIHSRDDLLRLDEEQEKQLCKELRAFLVENVSRTGGHLASNLGIVELTVAIQRVFDTARDRLVFDVGHQCYVHKILTGRMEQFGTLRQSGGISGFPKPCESVHDAFIAGHASNAVSVAYGMAKARTLAADDYRVIALLGDGALTGGLAYEGLNNAGASREPLIVILNDNGMSITPNVGAIARYLKKVRLSPDYLDFKLRYRAATRKTEFGRAVYRITHKVKARFRQSLLGTTIFENLGFTYLGPVDGHDSRMIASVLRAAAALHEPVLVHVLTQKGKGYEPAEKTPQNYHGVGTFDPETGIVCEAAGTDFSAVFGQALCDLAETEPRICALTAAMQHGTGLDSFAARFPNRFFDVGIAEEHAVCMAAGLAKQGMLPVLPIYSTFLQRGFDQLLHDAALQQLHVVFAVDRAGLVGADGETHHGMFDVGYLRQIPGMTVFCPASFSELRSMLKTAIFNVKGPVAVRFPRGSEGKYRQSSEAVLMVPGTDLTTVCYGTTYNDVLEAAEKAKEQGLSVEVLKLASIAPLDFAPILTSVKKTGRLLVAEECSDRLCLADEIFSTLAQSGISAKCRKVNLGRGFAAQGSVKELLRGCGLDADGLLRTMQEVLRDET